MEAGAGHTTSIWMATAEVPAKEALSQTVRTDVCVVGAGLAGLTTAYLLAQAGQSVVVIDQGTMAGGESARTTAHLTAALDRRYAQLEHLHGAQGARLAAESHTAAIDLIEAITEREGIDCEFERLSGYLVMRAGEATTALFQELQAVHRAGLNNVDYVQEPPYKHFEFGAAIRFPRQAQFHVLRYLAGLTRAVERLGGHLYENTHAVAFIDGTPARVETASGHMVIADHIVVATHSPVNNVITIHTKQAAYRTYVVGARVPNGSVPRMLLWDTADPYHYVRVQTVRDQDGHAHDVLLVGGEDHKAGQDDEPEVRYECLAHWARTHFPVMGAIEFQWSGQILEPIDGLGFIGRNPGDDHIYIVTGDSGNGMTHGTVAAMLLSDLILGRDNPWATLYDPSRKTLRAGLEFARENWNAVSQYKDLLAGSGVESTGAIEPGSGAVLRDGLRPIAVYRDPAGMLHELSAICPHLGCVVHWNPGESSWDCPCHGSRFAATGEVLHGPAVKNLGAAAEPEEESEKQGGGLYASPPPAEA